MYTVSSLVAPINSHFKTILQVKPYQLEEFCVPEDLDNEHAESLP